MTRQGRAEQPPQPISDKSLKEDMRKYQEWEKVQRERLFGEEIYPSVIPSSKEKKKSDMPKVTEITPGGAIIIRDIRPGEIGPVINNDKPENR